MQTFNRNLRECTELSRPQGLPCYITLADFNQLCRTITYEVLGKLIEQKPRATMVVEKTPDHVQHIGFIRALFPKAKIVHVIRDARDVVLSQMEAGKKSWGADWASQSPADAAKTWVEWTKQGCAWRAEPYPYIEVKYEDLRSNGPATLGRVYRFLGLPLPQARVEEIYKRFSLESCANGSAPQVLIRSGELAATKVPAYPEGFFRSAERKKKAALSPEDIAVIEQVAGPMLEYFKYPLPEKKTASSE